MRGGDQVPLAIDLLNAAQQEAPQATGFLGLSTHQVSGQAWLICRRRSPSGRISLLTTVVFPSPILRFSAVLESPLSAALKLLIDRRFVAVVKSTLHRCPFSFKLSFGTVRVDFQAADGCAARCLSLRLGHLTQPWLAPCASENGFRQPLLVDSRVGGAAADYDSVLSVATWPQDIVSLDPG